MINEIYTQIQQYYSQNTKAVEKASNFCVKCVFAFLVFMMLCLTLATIINNLKYKYDFFTSIRHWGDILEGIVALLIFFGFPLMFMIGFMLEDSIDSYFYKKLEVEKEKHLVEFLLSLKENQRELLLYFENFSYIITTEELNNFKYDLSQKLYINCAYKITDMIEKINNYHNKQADIAKFQSNLGIA